MAASATMPGMRRAEWVETVAEYRNSLDTDRPVLITAPAQQIMSRMRDWFGELADERVGGAVAVLAMSGIRVSARSMVVLRNPAALGLRRVSGANALAAQVRAGRVTIQAWGTSSDDPTRGIRRPRPRYSRAESVSLAAGLTASRAATGARYGILIRLSAGMSSEVVIDTGLVFEQETLSRVQNLAIAAGSVIGVDAGEPASSALPAWCLNRVLAPPGGEPVRPTSLYVPLTAGMSQGAVWSIVERSLNSFGAPV